MISRARLRRYAACVLALWVFGLGSGFVNACVVAAEVRHASHATAQAAQGHGHVHEHGGRAGDASSPGGAGSEQRPCERLCAEPTTASRHEKQSAILTGFFIVAPVSIHEIALRPRPPRVLASVAPDPGNPIPLSLAYLRLTL